MRSRSTCMPLVFLPSPPPNLIVEALALLTDLTLDHLPRECLLLVVELLEHLAVAVQELQHLHAQQVALLHLLPYFAQLVEGPVLLVAQLVDHTMQPWVGLRARATDTRKKLWCLALKALLVELANSCCWIR